MLSSKVCMLPMGALGFCIAFNASLCWEFCVPSETIAHQAGWKCPNGIGCTRSLSRCVVSGLLHLNRPGMRGYKGT